MKAGTNEDGGLSGNQLINTGYKTDGIDTTMPIYTTDFIRFMSYLYAFDRLGCVKSNGA
jgi:hypothetical protein